MNYKFYKSPPFNSVLGADFLDEESHSIDGYKITLVRGKRKGGFVNFYFWDRIGINKILNGKSCITFIYLGKEISKILNQIHQLFLVYEYNDLLKELENYPYIVNTVFALPPFTNICCDFYDTYQTYFGNFVKSHSEYFKEHIVLSNTPYVPHSKDCYFLQSCQFYGDNCVEKALRQVDTLVKYADNLIYELKFFKLDTRQLNYSKSYLEKKNFVHIINPQFEKILTIGGYFAVKALARSLGSDTDVSYDFEIPDIDIDLNSLDGIDFDSIDTISDIQQDTQSSDDVHDNLNDCYNISFQGTERNITVHQEGNSERTTTVTAKKVSGTSNTWEIYKGSTLITKLQGIRNGRFYLDGFGNAVIN